MYSFRRAGPTDVPVIVDYRLRMFASFLGDTYDYEALARFEISHLTKEMEAGRFAAWVAENSDGEAVASAGVSFYTITPKPWNLEGRHAFISSMYTLPEHRKKGIGSRLLQETLDYVRSVGVEYVTLHASEAGRSLYRSFGFKETNEMRLRIEPAGKDVD